MTREEQIIEASQLYAKAYQKPFMDGAMWADEHPINYDGKVMLHVFNKGHEQGYKDAIDKACAYLLDKFKPSFNDYAEYLVTGFKEHMEELV